MSRHIRIGLLRLVDSAPVIVAEAHGLFAEQGLDVTVSIEPSWANIADKLAYGLLDAAVMLPPLALAASAGLRGPKARLLVPMSLSQGGNAIAVSHAAADALSTGGGRLLDWLRAEPAPPRFAVVHAFSTHNLLLRYWLAAGGADPDRDIETVSVPPEDVVAALASGSIAGFCAGAPWGDVAERSGAGRVLLGTSAIWPYHPEKCLCVHAGWAEANPAVLQDLLRTVLRAQMRCDLPEEAPGIAALLADPKGLNLPQEASRAALPGGGGAEQIRFHTGEAWYPARAHAVWFLGQMRRWGWLDDGADLEALAARVYRPDLLAPAIEAEGLRAAATLPALESSAMLPVPGHEAFAPGRR
jgi:NitT/TauT family transport system ATP-binding protein/nitrate/nitrite transport system substrate-binding protein